jgi:hypothetical protein
VQVATGQFVWVKTDEHAFLDGLIEERLLLASATVKNDDALRGAHFDALGQPLPDVGVVWYCSGYWNRKTRNDDPVVFSTHDVCLSDAGADWSRE